MWSFYNSLQKAPFHYMYYKFQDIITGNQSSTGLLSMRVGPVLYLMSSFWEVTVYDAFCQEIILEKDWSPCSLKLETAINPLKYCVIYLQCLLQGGSINLTMALWLVHLCISRLFSVLINLHFERMRWKCEDAYFYLHTKNADQLSCALRVIIKLTVNVTLITSSIIWEYWR